MPFCFFGWLSGSGGEVMDITPQTTLSSLSNGWADIATAFVVWSCFLESLYLFAIIYYILQRVDRTHDLSRQDRHKRNTQLNIILVHLNKLVIEYGRDLVR